MSNFKVKTQVKVTDDIFTYDNKPHKDGRIQKTSEPLLVSFTNATIPNPAALPDGLSCYNSDLKAVVVTSAGAWVKA